jgi:hypothetical protein
MIPDDVERTFSLAEALIKLARNWPDALKPVEHQKDVMGWLGGMSDVCVSLEAYIDMVRKGEKIPTEPDS